MKKLSFAAGVSAIALAVSTIFPVAGVFANTATYDSGNSTVTLERNVTNVTNPVTNIFTYTVTPGDDNPGTVSGYPTTTEIEFNNTAPTGTTATLTTTLNFSSTNYEKVGDYIFRIKEYGTTDDANYPIDAAHNDYIVQVRVRYAVDENNVPINNTYLATLVLLDSNLDKVSSGVASWTSGAGYTYIETTATTTGNMAEKDKCFEYTINIPATGVVATDSTFTIDSNTTCSGGASSVTAGQPATVYLMHGDTLTVGVNNGINELPVGANYTITNVGDSDYTTKIDGTTTDETTKTTVAVNDANFNTNNKTAIEQNKETNPLTGVVTNFWFYIILLMIGAFGIFFIIARRKNEDEEQ